MKRVFKVLLVLLVALMPVLAVNAKSKTTTTTVDKSKTPVNFYIFYGNGCPHCEDLLNYVAELDKDSNYNYMYKVVKYETWYNSENAALMQKVFNYFGVTDTKEMGVPLYVIGDKHFTGFPDPDSATEEMLTTTYNNLKEAIKTAYNNENYKDIVAGIGQGTIDVSDSDKDEESTKKTNDIIGYVIIGIVVLIIIAIIFGRSKSDTYYPVEEAEEDEEVEETKVEEVKPVATKVAVKKTATKKAETKKASTKSTTKKTTKTTSTKKTTKTTSTKKTTKKNTKKK